MFENEIIRGIHISRYVMSFYKMGGKSRELEGWLRQLTINGEPLTDNEIKRIRNFAENGKFELEMNAKRFLSGKA